MLVVKWQAVLIAVTAQTRRYSHLLISEKQVLLWALTNIPTTNLKYPYCTISAYLDALLSVWVFSFTAFSSLLPTHSSAVKKCSYPWGILFASCFYGKAISSVWQKAVICHTKSSFQNGKNRVYEVEHLSVSVLNLVRAFGLHHTSVLTWFERHTGRLLKKPVPSESEGARSEYWGCYQS